LFIILACCCGPIPISSRLVIKLHQACFVKIDLGLIWRYLVYSNFLSFLPISVGVPDFYFHESPDAPPARDFERPVD